MNKYSLFRQLPVDHQFYYGDNPARLFFKVTPIHAILVVDFDNPTKQETYHLVNPNVLVFWDKE